MIAERFASQLLTGRPARDAVTVARRLLAVQGQDQRGARLAIRCRTTGLVAADVDRELTEHRTLVITWLNRGTLHLVCSEDYWWLHDLTTPQLATGNATRLAQEGVSPSQAERAVRIIEKALAGRGPQTRAQLRDVLDTAGIPTAGQALVHLLAKATFQGHVVRGPMAGREQAFVLVRDWLGTPPDFNRETALAELARRYLAGHAPADERDLARWAGVPLRDARAGLSAIAADLRQRPDGLVELKGPSRARAPRSLPMPHPRLLGAFDPILLGWCSRQPILREHQSIVTVNGLFRPFAMVDGIAVGTWRIAGQGVEIEPFAPLDRTTAAALEADGADVLRFLGIGGH